MRLPNGTPSGARRVRDAALVLCALWLVTQNLLLLSFLPWPSGGALWTVLAALGKVAWAAFAPLAAIAVAGVLGAALTMWLVFARTGSFRPRDLGVRHG